MGLIFYIVFLISFLNLFKRCLAVIIGPSPQMASVIKEYQCGLISKDFSNAAMINLLQNISIEEIDECKKNSNTAALDLCWEKSLKSYLVSL